MIGDSAKLPWVPVSMNMIITAVLCMSRLEVVLVIRHFSSGRLTCMRTSSRLRVLFRWYLTSTTFLVSATGHAGSYCLKGSSGYSHAKSELTNDMDIISQSGSGRSNVIPDSCRNHDKSNNTASCAWRGGGFRSIVSPVDRRRLAWIKRDKEQGIHWSPW